MQAVALIHFTNFSNQLTVYKDFLGEWDLRS